MSFMPCLATPHAAALALTAMLAGGMMLPAHADNPPEQAAPLALTTIMRDLGKDLQGVTDGIAREDWPAVA